MKKITSGVLTVSLFSLSFHIFEIPTDLPLGSALLGCLALGAGVAAFNVHRDA